MEIETRPGWPDGFCEFQWPKVQFMIGYDLCEWCIGVRFHKAYSRSVSLYLLCFDMHFQWGFGQTVGDEHGK